MFDPAQPSIAVAFVVDSQGRSLLTWNAKWGAFTLPMTKLNLEPPAEAPPRDGDIKDYQYNVVPVKAHPDFASSVRLGQPVVWAAIDKLQTDEYQPVSKSVEAILRQCIQWGWI